MPSRRHFLGQFGALAVAPWFRWSPSAMQADVVIIGGGTGGCAAALGALRAGLRVVMTEETDWIGGQLTQQAVPPDEHPWIEQFGATASYRRFREEVRRYYRTWYPLTGGAYADPRLNPGSCGVSYLCHEPRVALAVLEAMLAPYVGSGQLRILRDTAPIGAAVDRDRVESVHVRHRLTGDELDLAGPIFIDATETGELLPLTGTEYVTGFESQRETGERLAPAEAQPHNMQAPTWCFAMDYVEGEDFAIARPEQYDFWRAYVPDLAPAWPGRLLGLTYTHPITLEPNSVDFDPRPGAQTERFNLWNYRRLVDPALFRDEAARPGVSLVNWPQNDYLLGNLFEVSAEDAVRHAEGARQVSLSLFYWLQTEAPRPDGGAGWRGLRLRGDLTGTEDGMAKRPYIRESRRIRAEFTVAEQHVGLDARMAETGMPAGEVTAAPFWDSVGIGSYRIDLHPSTGGDNYIDVASLPFQIPLGALLPVRMRNLLPACKNLGVTHITNGCYRLHPVEWNIGESAGALAAFALRRGEPVHAVRANRALFDDFRRELVAAGVEVAWVDPGRVVR